MDELGEFQVVEAEHRHIFRAAQSGLAQRRQSAQGDEVIAGEDRRRPRAQSQDGAHLFVAAQPVETALLDVLGIDLYLRALEGGAKSFESRARIRQLQVASDDRDAAMSHRQQVLGARACSGSVIHRDGIAGPARGPAVKADDRTAARQVGTRVHAAVHRRDHDQPRHAIRPQLVQIRALFRGIVVGIAQHELIRILVRHILGAAHHSRKERIGDVRDDHSEDGGLVAAQSAGEFAGLIAEARDRFQYASAQRFAHRRVLVDDVRYRPDRDTGGARDVAHGDGADWLGGLQGEP